ncbi:hypothetical protein Pedsa_3099 [Pseudopedobacter saltans DSM 12145]|uniref:Fibrobacter succinogenes major paralogous domain-containing protein n=1 Tax=Pseudopedobacter saltans (strain ATCC 51119 / DSM 12145 / JCM 21818 / CCUG 39354 / LMG 10337 / NBRC 100064 / NCIMB 13643) TaxID=762903 RepID=F0SA74_PSESL|nr:hypothetical protein [Pseudopedobacter saltans]ADY53638.1 hypothetical protein Pedsa_3099 [Pseudopedobacter saltans DSM 12145]
MKNQLLLTCVIMLFVLGCKKSDNDGGSSVDLKIETAAVSNLTAVSVKTGGVISGSEPINERGVCWGAENNPTVEGGKFVADIDVATGEYSVKIKDLDPEKVYYVRAYAKTKSGKTVYGKTLEIATKTLTALAESNSYLTVFDDALVIPVSRANKTSLGTQISSTETLTAELLWMDNYDVIDDVKIVGTGASAKVVVSAGNVNGNAVVAVKNASNEIKWSWHIWVVEDLKAIGTITLPSGAKIMDRNLGAINKNPEDAGAIGLQYQFGRKDPFTASTSFGTPSEVLLIDLAGKNPAFQFEAGPKTLAYSIKKPLSFIKSAGVDWEENGSTLFWTNDLGTKTVYDPCPLGYKVPAKEITEGLEKTHFNTAQNGGFLFLYNNQNNIFPYTGYREANGSLDATAFSGNLWFNSSLEGFAFLTTYQNGAVYQINGSPRARAMCIRCIEDK